MSLNSKSIESQFNLNEANSHLENIYEFENFSLDAARMMLYENGREVELAPKVVETLLALIERCGEIVSKREMMNRLWADSFVEEANLTQNIYLLRKTLGKGADGRDLIETFRRRGYRFNGEIKTPEKFGMSVTPSAESPIITEEIGAKAKKTTETSAVSGVLSRQKRSKTLWVTGAVISGLLIVFLGIFIFNKLRSGTAFQNKPIDSIAVLPFVNESGNSDLEYLSDGMTETLIGSLSQIPKLNVKARSSIFRYKGKETEAKQIGADLNVQAVLTGRVVQRGDDLTLFLSLINVATENNIWSKQYNRKLTNLVALQTEIARDVSESLKTKLSGVDEKKLAKSYTENAEAYRLYLQGRYFWNKRTDKDIRKSIEYFNQAVALDPNYALAYAGIADAYCSLSFYAALPENKPENTFLKAREPALRALEIDSELAEAHASLGFIKERYDWDFAAAERQYKRAIELNPDYATVHHRYGVFLSAMGRFDEAIAELELARRLDPLSLIIATDSSLPYFWSRRYDRAVEELRKALEMDPNFARAHQHLSTNYRWLGRYEEAIAEMEKALELTGGLFREDGLRRGGLQLALFYAAAGRKSEGEKIAEKILAEMDKRERQGEYVPPSGRANYYAQLGEKDQAFFWLEKAYKERWSGMVELKVSRAWDNLRDDPRFQDLLRRVGHSP